MPTTLLSVRLESALAGLLLSLSFGCAAPPPVVEAPPYEGTAYIDPDLIVASDPSALLSLEFAGRGVRTMFDRRADAFVSVDAYLFNVTFEGAAVVEAQVNAEFGDAALAERHAAFYARAIGQLPAGLRTRVETVWIHRGDMPFGGGNDNILIHTGQAADYLRRGVLEEILMHEAAHTSLDPSHAATEDWLAAQTADGRYISNYARDNPRREDVAESFGPFFALRHRPDRIPRSMIRTIETTMPNRIEFFNQMDLDMHPVR